MDFENEIKYVENKDYTFVLSYNYFNKYENKDELDISIFEIEEWKNYLKLVMYLKMKC